MFTLKRPCADCPFRKDTGHLFGLREERIREIVEAAAFQCHKTLGVDDEGEHTPGTHPQQCAGLMALLHRENRPNQIMQVATRLGAFDPAQLDLDLAYETIAAAIEAHKRFSA